ncbi:MAG: class I SAM-dependent methyltransferase [Rhizobiales bacterium]|nr:class I SAM-dependent methyltransferase [Hyphomicrobiales bacterium]
MGFYDRYILPRVINWSCGAKPVQKQRQKVVPLAEGRVLEIGIGSGLNLPFYDAEKIDRLIGLDPADEMLAYARRESATVPFPVEYLALEGENIPLDARSIDTVLITYTLCTIPDAIAALEGMRRVLKENGRLIFCEHGKAPDEAVRRWQDRLNPLWKRIGGGCNLNRDIPALIESAGFAIDTLETMYLPSTPRFAAFNYWGSATAR